METEDKQLAAFDEFVCANRRWIKGYEFWRAGAAWARENFNGVQSTPEKTDWFYCSPPVHSGVYEVDFGFGVQYSYWDNDETSWFGVSNTLEQMPDVSPRWRAWGRVTNFPQRWRGLTAQAQQNGSR